MDDKTLRIPNELYPDQDQGYFETPQTNQENVTNLFKNAAESVGSTVEADNIYETESNLASIIGKNASTVIHLRHQKFTADTGANIAGFKDNTPYDEMSKEAGPSVFRKAIRKIIPIGSNIIPTDRELIRAESSIGGKLFGPIPKGHRREFFCLDEHTWVWYESTVDPINKNVSAITTRYETRGDNVIKIQEGQPHRYASLAEANNLAVATTQYVDKVQSQIYTQAAA